MKKRIITTETLRSFRAHLVEGERSPATIEKYLRDVGRLRDCAAGAPICKQLLLDYKARLEQEYAVTSANSMLGAINTYLRFMQWDDLCLRQLRVQKSVYCSDEKELTKEEYTALVRAAEAKNDQRLALVLQTICATGIRVSELRHITVEAAQRGEAEVSCKGKSRKIFIVSALQEKLLRYAAQNGVSTGSVFVTRTGKTLDRSNIWREMKTLCQSVGIPHSKVYPHNLRHLFARAFYDEEKDLAKLADVLGHSNINTTRIYIISTGAEHQRRMENLRLIV